MRSPVACKSAVDGGLADLVLMGCLELVCPVSVCPSPRPRVKTFRCWAGPEFGSRLTSANQHHIVIATALASFHSIVVPRGLEPRTLRLLAVRSNQLSYETSGNAVRFSHPKKCPSKHKTKHADQFRTTVQPSFFGMEPKPIPNLLVPTLRSNGIPIRGLRVPNC